MTYRHQLTALHFDFVASRRHKEQHSPARCDQASRLPCYFELSMLYCVPVKMIR